MPEAGRRRVNALRVIAPDQVGLVLGLAASVKRDPYCLEEIVLGKRLA
jgi:hypothetical protein